MPLVRQLEAADPLGDGSGEGAALVAEEFALQQSRRNGGAVHGDEGVVAACAALVNGASDKLFAGASLPLDKHCGVGRGHDLDLREHLGQRGAGANDLVEIVRCAKATSDGLYAPLSGLPINNAPRRRCTVVKGREQKDCTPCSRNNSILRGNGSPGRDRGR